MKLILDLNVRLAAVAFAWGSLSHLAAAVQEPAPHEGDAKKPASHVERAQHVTSNAKPTALQALRTALTHLETPELRLRYPHSEARAIQAIREAGRDGAKETIPDLRLTAITYSESRDELVTLEALDAMWRLGESESTFLGYLEGWRESPKLALHALLVLGRSLNPVYVERGKAIAAAAAAEHHPDTRYFQANVFFAEQAIRTAQRFHAAELPREKLAAIGAASLGGFNVVLDHGGGMEQSLQYANPRVVVARDLLRILSTEDAFSMVQLVRDTTFAEFLPESLRHGDAGNTTLWKLRDELARHLSAQGRALYGDQRPGWAEKQARRL